MSVLKPRSTGNLVRDLEQHMTRERELGVWGFPHLVRYLRAIIFKLTPQPHRCSLAVLDAAAHVLATNEPALLTRFLSTPPEGRTAARVAREAANAIVEVVGHWAGWDGAVKFRPSECASAYEHAYERAKRIVARIERDVLDVGLTAETLYDCAVDAHGEQIDPDRRDAAIAAMTAGHFKLSHDIVTGTPGENN